LVTRFADIFSRKGADPTPLAQARQPERQQRMAEALRALLALRAATARPDNPRGAPSPAAETALSPMVEVAATLWTRAFRFDAAAPAWADRDRLIVSCREQMQLLRAVLELSGVEPADFVFGLPGLDTVFAPPGQALACAVGAALAERMLAARFGKSLCDHRTWLFSAPTDLIGGQSYEAAFLAGDLKLGKLALFVEEPATASAAALVNPLLERFAGWGWATKRIAAQDPAAVSGALSIALRARKPLLISCRRPSHPPKMPDHPPSDDVREAWKAAGARNTTTRRGWLKRLARHAQAGDFERGQSGRLPDGWRDTVRAERAKLADIAAPLSPLAASRQLLSGMAETIPDLTAASTGLAEKKATAPIAGAGIVDASDFGGRHISFAGAETAMPGVLAGLAGHGGFTLIAESPASGADSLPLTLRPLAREGRRMIHSLTEDHGDPAAAAALPLASLRAIPNLFVFRPACAIETAECWELALQRDDGPSVLIHSTQEMPRWRAEGTENACARGGYVAAGAYDARAATLIASGAELAIALDARRLLVEMGISVAVVSLPCWSLFVSQSEAYRADVLGEAPRLAVEAGSDFGWGRWLGERGQFIGAASLGLTAARPGEYFGVTAEALVIAVKKKL
jgi:transketolase